MAKLRQAYLSCEDDNDKEHSNPGTSDTEDGLEWDVVGTAALILPCCTESDVCHADATPGEEGSETRERLQPGEDLRTAACKCDVRDGTEGNDGDGGEERTASTVDVGEDLRRIALLSQSSQRSGTAVDARQANADNCQQDYDIDEVSESWDAGVDSGNDEWRGRNIDVAGAQKSFVSVWNKQANEEEGQDVEATDIS